MQPEGVAAFASIPSKYICKIFLFNGLL